MVYEALEQTGWKGDPAELTAALKKLNHGIPAQDEFCLLLSWLGRCKLIHSLGQRQYPPSSVSELRVPDFLAVFETVAGLIPVLIEVKSKAGSRLSWRPDYFEALERYGKLLGLPVLLAWKEPRINMWSLVDTSMFHRAQKNYNLTFGVAMQNNLMSMLAGDFMIEFTPGFGLHLHLRKLGPGSEAGLHCEVDQAYFLGPSGVRFTTLKGGLWPFFMTLDVHSELQETETHFHQSFVVREGHGSQLAHRGFPALFPTEKGKRWRTLLEAHSFKVLPQDLIDAAAEAFAFSATSRLTRIVPQQIPSYLEDLKKAMINKSRAAGDPAALS
jgi:Holliday junction resolvase